MALLVLFLRDPSWLSQTSGLCHKSCICDLRGGMGLFSGRGKVTKVTDGI